MGLHFLGVSQQIGRRAGLACLTFSGSASNPYLMLALRQISICLLVLSGLLWGAYSAARSFAFVIKVELIAVARCPKVSCRPHSGASTLTILFPKKSRPFPEENPGTIVVDPDAGFLHLIGENGRAMRYGAGTGAAALQWQGVARLQSARSWPRGKVPETMIARALYLFQNGEDTLCRIHGACKPQCFGKAVSSGCIRLLDQDVIDLHGRVRHGVSVRVLPSLMPPGLSSLY